MCWNMEKYVIIIVGARRWEGTEGKKNDLTGQKRVNC